MQEAAQRFILMMNHIPVALEGPYRPGLKKGNKKYRLAIVLIGLCVPC